MKTSNQLSCLLTSQTRLKLIDVIFYHPGEIFYVRQLVRLCKEEINSVRRELANLSKHNLVLSENRGNRIYYWANPENRLYSDLIILAHKISGLGSQLVDAKFVFFSLHFLVGSQKANSIDLIVVTDGPSRDIDRLVKEEEKRLGREINYMIMDKSELKIRKHRRDPVIAEFFLNSPVLIQGNPLELANI